MAKKKAEKPVTPQSLFMDWWEKTGSKKAEKMEADYLKDNPDYDPEDDDMSDGGCVHRMMHEGEAVNMTYDAAEVAFVQGYNNEKIDADCLYCELDDVVSDAYEAGKKQSK